MIYLCGGINGLSDADCKNWREQAKSLLKGVTLDPMVRDFRGREDQAGSMLVHADLHDISKCQFLLVNATRPSWGTAMELVYAHQSHKTVIAFVAPGNPISPWLRYHCSEIHLTLEAACDSINSLVEFYSYR